MFDPCSLRTIWVIAPSSESSAGPRLQDVEDVEASSKKSWGGGPVPIITLLR
jgi:hypothetical protein